MSPLRPMRWPEKSKQIYPQGSSGRFAQCTKTSAALSSRAWPPVSLGRRLRLTSMASTCELPLGEGATVLISSDKGLAVYWAEVQLGGHELVVNLYAGRQSEEGRMTYWRMAVVAVLVLLSSEVAAQSNLIAKCNAQFRKCNS